MNRFIKRNLSRCSLETVDQDDNFGVYSEQEGDRTPTFSVTEQIDLSAEYITSFILTED